MTVSQESSLGQEKPCIRIASQSDLYNIKNSFQEDLSDIWESDALSEPGQIYRVAFLGQDKASIRITAFYGRSFSSQPADGWTTNSG